MSIVAILLLIAQIALKIPEILEVIRKIMDLIKKLPNRGGKRHEARGKLGRILKQRLAQHAEKGLVNADAGELEALASELEAQIKAKSA
jgi:hypothetical protein